MSTVFKGMRLFAMAVLVLAVVAGCSSGGNNAGTNGGPAAAGTGGETAAANQQSGDDKPAAPEPVTLKVLWHDPANFEKWFTSDTSPIKKAFPHITFELLQVEGYYQNQLDQVLSTGEKPDLIWGNIYTISLTEQAGMFEDLTGMLAEKSFDTSRYQTGILEEIGAYTPTEGVQYLVPWNRSYTALAYNKDIFDKFNVPYPSDDMTWDQVYELAKQLTREDGGVKYRGFEFGDPETAIKQMPNFIIDTESNTADISWIRPVLDNIDRFWTVPGMLAPSEEPHNHSTANQGWTRFINDRNLAMVAGGVGVGVNGLGDSELKDGLHWDIVTYPSFADRPGEAPGVYIDGWGISVTSQHKDTVYEVIEYITRPDVVEAFINQDIDPAVLELLKTKNMDALTKHAPSARQKKMNILEENSKAAFWEGLNVLAARQKDVNSTLQLMQEIAAQKFEEAKAQQ